jgi:hypothetical protein
MQKKDIHSIFNNVLDSDSLIPDPDPGFDDQKVEKITEEKKSDIFFFKSKITIYLEDVEATGDAFSLTRELPALNFLFFSTFVDHICPPGSDPDPESGLLHSECRCRTQPL